MRCHMTQTEQPAHSLRLGVSKSITLSVRVSRSYPMGQLNKTSIVSGTDGRQCSLSGFLLLYIFPVF